MSHYKYCVCIMYFLKLASLAWTFRRNNKILNAIKSVVFIESLLSVAYTMSQREIYRRRGYTIVGILWQFECRGMQEGRWPTNPKVYVGFNHKYLTTTVTSQNFIHKLQADKRSRTVRSVLSRDFFFSSLSQMT